MTVSEYLLLSISLGLIVSLNPLMIAIFIKKIVSDFGIYSSRKKIIASSMVYIFGFMVSGLSFSKLIYLTLNNLEPINFYFIVILVAILAILFGTTKIISYFNKQPLYSVPEITESFVHKISCKKNNYLTTALLGLASVLILISSYGLMLFLLNSTLIINKISVLSGWSVVFIISSCFTMFGLALVANYKNRVSLIVKWNNDNKNTLRLYSGLLQILFAWLVLVQISGIKVW